MDNTQINQLVNSIFKEENGTVAIANENLQGVVDAGSEILGDFSTKDTFTNILIDKIGKTVFVNRAYDPIAPSVLRNAVEYGSIVQKIDADAPEAGENMSWELKNGQSYDPNIFTAPTVRQKFFDMQSTYEIPLSYVDEQLHQAFDGPAQLGAFINMLRTKVKNSASVYTNGLIRRTINNFTAETLYNAYSSGTTFTQAGNTRAVNLLVRYKIANSASLTAEQAVTDPDFIRYAVKYIRDYVGYMRDMSTLFNMEGRNRHTPRDLQHIVMLDYFASAADIYLQSDVWHNELTRFPDYETIPYWQGSGTDLAFGSVSKIDVTTSAGHDVEASGILAVIFDRDALGIWNYDEHVTTHYNPRAEFWNNWYKYKARYFNDFAENFVVFFVA